jgi:hypothetical protein
MLSMLCSALALFLATNLPASAALPDAAAYRPVAVQLGVGHRYGVAGAAVTWRLHRRFAAVLGGGAYGVGGGARAYAWRGLYGQVGFAPLVVTEDRSVTLYGPDATVGWDFRAGRFSLTAGGGVGAYGWPVLLRATPTLDLGLGVNLGPVRD